MRLFASYAVLLLCIALRSEAAAATLAAWVQLGPNGAVSARAVTDDSSCPTLRGDGVALTMTVRAPPDAVLGNVPPAVFDVRTCEAAVASGTAELLLDGKPLPLPHRELRRIIVIGDTGCRLKAGAGLQDCNDGDAWPYARIAAHAAVAHPDLVIHVGDYHYRESACPAERSGCAGSPFGYGWDAWNADFFAPSAALLASAPWLLVRGNHEDCDRAGEGWFRFLAAAPFPQRCDDLTGFFVTAVAGMGFVVMDGARAGDPTGDPQPLIRKLADQFAEVRAAVPAEAWLLTHRPVNGMRTAAPLGPDSVDNKVQQAAIGAALPAGVRMVVSGHIHVFQALDFNGERPPQLVVGTSGDALMPAPEIPLAGKDVNGVRVAVGAARFGFGYMVWDRTDTVWNGTLFDADGRPVRHCRLAGRRLACDS